MGGFIEYDQYDGVGLGELVRAKQVKPTELIEEAAARIDAVNPKINAVVFEMLDLALERARGEAAQGSFAGVPFLLKDLGPGYAGAPTSFGSRFCRGLVFDHDTEMVKRYKAAGLNVLGKTNTPEFGLSPVTEPELFGPCRNPWDLTRTTGGSSGGSAAAVAARMVPLAHGNDGAGSIRIPSSCCGVFGLKPTRARTPCGPDVGESWHGLSIDHVISRSVRDSAAALDATAGGEVGAPYFAAPVPYRFLDQVTTDPGRLRIAVDAQPPFPSGAVDPECLHALEATARLCQDLGHDITETHLPIDEHALAAALTTVICVSVRAQIEEAEIWLNRKATNKDFEAVTWALAQRADRIRSAEFSRAIQYFHASSRRIGHFFEEYDVLLTPTLPRPPILVGAPRFISDQDELLWGPLGALADEMFDLTPYTPPFNITGQPAMSVPLWWTDQGLPIGMHFVGRYGDEATLFRLAGQLEKARPWFDRRPPHYAGEAQQASEQ